MNRTVRTSPSRRLAFALALVAMVVVVLATAAAATAAVDTSKLVIYTTTSLNDSKLIDDVIKPAYQAKYPGVTTFEVHAVGSGQAITAGRTGLADILLVHSPADEKTLLDDGVATLRLPFAYNYFVIVGPPRQRDGYDPAHVYGSKTARGAFLRIAKWGDALVAKGSARKAFTSRGDNSGTNKKELALWYAAKVTASATASPTGAWYESAGAGMAATLTIANEHRSYTLVDIATWLTWRKAYMTDHNGDKPYLTQLLMKRAELKNQYSVLLLDPAVRPDINSAGAARLAQWIVSGTGQEAIGEFGKADFGRSLFFPNAFTISDPIVP